MNIIAQAWSKVELEAARLEQTRLLDLFAADPKRVESLTFEAPHLIADFSKQRVDAGALAALGALAQAADFDGWRAKMFAGDEVNSTEHRAVMHWALRAPQPPPEVAAVRKKMVAFAQKIRHEIDAIIHLGIGGSDLGPRLLIDALKPHRRNGLDVRFAANVDGAGFFRQLFYIRLPLLLPIMAVAVLYGIVFTFTDMTVVYILTRGGPVNATQVLASWAYFRGIEAGALAQGAAVALFLFPVLVGVAALMLRLAKRAETV